MKILLQKLKKEFDFKCYKTRILITQNGVLNHKKARMSSLIDFSDDR
jgi:hypothetical protein